MTNTESRNCIGLDELDSLDDTDTFESAEQQITEADIRELAIYGFDSDKQTLVGLGPVERARRSRQAAEIPESQPAPQSESHGPFIADDEIPPSLRRRKVGPWAVAAFALLSVAIAAVVALRTLAPSASHASAASPPVVAVAAQLRHDEPPPPTLPVLPPPEPEPAPPPAEVVPATDTANVLEPAVGAQRARAAVPVVPAALRVTLPDLPPPSVVDLSPAGDPSVGTINVTSTPPANVVLDDRPLGKAPRVARVPAGVHTIVLIHPLYGRRALSVDVIPGATARASAEF